MTITKRVMNSSQLGGLTGDHGETWVAFFHWIERPLSSVWAWFHTKEEAEAFNPELRAKDET